MQTIKRNLYILIAFSFFSVGIGGFFLLKKTPRKDVETFKLSKEEGYFIPLKIYGYSQGNAPFLEVTIGNMIIPTIIDLGFQGMFSLPSDLIKNIDEKNGLNTSEVMDSKEYYMKMMSMRLKI